ncbi:hypothetical protein [Catenulispora sp. MAP5-51]|uniref:hypothetical protein n=1 Tax=Catenulispora sp. MAP5-51 TaxID=3156298 RepID=UPI00351111AF
MNALLAPRGVFEQAAEDPNTVLIADVGRVDADLPEAASLLLLADVLMLTVRPIPEQILSLAGASKQARRPHPDTGLLLIGPGYPAEHVSELLRLPVFGQLPLIPTGAALWQRLTWRKTFRRAAAQVGQVISARSSGDLSAAYSAIDETEAAASEGVVRV